MHGICLRLRWLSGLSISWRIGDSQCPWVRCRNSLFCSVRSATREPSTRVESEMIPLRLRQKWQFAEPYDAMWHAVDTSKIISSEIPRWCLFSPFQIGSVPCRVFNYSLEISELYLASYLSTINYAYNSYYFSQENRKVSNYGWEVCFYPTEISQWENTIITFKWKAFCYLTDMAAVTKGGEVKRTVNWLKCSRLQQISACFSWWTYCKWMAGSSWALVYSLISCIFYKKETRNNEKQHRRLTQMFLKEADKLKAQSKIKTLRLQSPCHLFQEAAFWLVRLVGRWLSLGDA